MDHHEKELVLQMMELVSSAKECTPALFQYPLQQEEITVACREAAHKVFEFKEILKGMDPNSIDTKAILAQLTDIEAKAKTISEKIKTTPLVALEPTLYSSFQENYTKLGRVISLFRIHLGKLRIKVGLSVISKLSRADFAPDAPTIVQEITTPALEPAPSMSPDVPKKSDQNSWAPATNSPARPHPRTLSLRMNPQKSSSFIMTPKPTAVMDYLLRELLKPAMTFPFPQDVDVARRDLESNQWLLNFFRQEYQKKVETELELQRLTETLDLEKRAFADWKSKAVEMFKKVVDEKEQQLEEKSRELRKISEELPGEDHVKQLQQLNMDKDKSFLIQISLKEEELERQIRKTELIQKEMITLDQKYHATKDAMSLYIIEVEEWKKETTQKFLQVLQDKDAEILELKETVELLMQKGDSTEQEDLMNQLLEYIGATPGSDENSTKSEAIVTRIRGESKADQGRKSSLKNKLTLKIILPDNDGILMIESQPTATLESILQTVIQQKKLRSDAGYGFKTADGAADFVRLSKQVGELGTQLSLNLVAKDPKNVPKDITGSPRKMPAAFTEPSLADTSVEELILLVESKLDEPKVSDGLILPCKGFDIELGNRDRPSLSDINTKKLVHIDSNTPYYQHYFHGKPHVNYYGTLAKASQGVVIVSLEVEDKDGKAKGLLLDKNRSVRALVRTKQLDEWVFIPVSSKGRKKTLIKAMIEKCADGPTKFNGLKLQELTKPSAADELMKMEQRLIVKGYKIGVLYATKGQTQENEMFSNVQPSADFVEFLDFLGEKIVLKDWKGFRGGLDVKTDTTGTHSIWTKHLGFEIMFHVSTMLPYSAQDKQQLERKRHLGNDVCTIVFQDSDEPFHPETVRTEFTHVWAVVTPDRSSTHKTTHYKLAFAYKGGVGMSQPLLPHPCILEKTKILRDFLLTKIINSERCAMYAPSFVNRLATTKEQYMEHVISTLTNKDD
eukprot:TRINITY_DN5196_c0_g1_i1.p1 TRINITY_DN5196_c0_g1~~TRINITY_DN5196_c0_g1_i1.p1  ORF type:complete len:962 (+),score=316.20 TRINITY_DN5196_c0_g1_i1:150-3035(+)